MINQRHAFHFAGGILAVVALAYFGRVLTDYWAQSSESILRTGVVVSSAISVLFLVVGYAVSALGWLKICHALQLEIAGMTALRIYFISQFGKYLPGNVGHHAGRLALGMREKLPALAMTTSQLLEILMVVAILGGIGLAAGSSYAWLWRPQWLYFQPWTIGVVVLATIAGACLAIRILASRSAKAAHVASLLRKLIASGQALRHLVDAVVFMIANVCAATAGLYFITDAISESPAPPVLAVCSTFVISWLAGFLTPGAPAGLGVRETVMLTMLEQNMSTPEAAAASLVFRIVTTSTDLVVLAIGLAMSSLQRRFAPLS